MVRIAIALLSSILETWGIILLTPLTPLQADDAVIYAEWRSDRDAAHYRLPTEAEWETAARGRDGQYFMGEPVAGGGHQRSTNRAIAHQYRGRVSPQPQCFRNRRYGWERV